MPGRASGLSKPRYRTPAPAPIPPDCERPSEPPRVRQALGVHLQSRAHPRHLSERRPPTSRQAHTSRAAAPPFRDPGQASGEAQSPPARVPPFRRREPASRRSPESHRHLLHLSARATGAPHPMTMSLWHFHPGPLTPRIHQSTSARDLSPAAPSVVRNPEAARAAGTYSLERASDAPKPRRRAPSPALSPRGPEASRSPTRRRPRGTYFGGSGQVKRVPPCPNRPSLHHRRTAQPRSRT